MTTPEQDAAIHTVLGVPNAPVADQPAQSAGGPVTPDLTPTWVKMIGSTGAGMLAGVPVAGPMLFGSLISASGGPGEAWAGTFIVLVGMIIWPLGVPALLLAALWTGFPRAAEKLGPVIFGLGVLMLLVGNAHLVTRGGQESVLLIAGGACTLLAAVPGMAASAIHWLSKQGRAQQQSQQRSNA